MKYDIGSSVTPRGFVYLRDIKVAVVVWKFRTKQHCEVVGSIPFSRARAIAESKDAFGRAPAYPSQFFL